MTTNPSIGVLVGNPRQASRTLHAALSLAEAVRRATSAGTQESTAELVVVDAAEIAPEVFHPGSGHVRNALASLAEVDVLVVASPTYKATYTGLLKAILDQAPGGWLRHRIAIPLLVAASDRHALAVEVHLRPLLVELGALIPGPGVFLNESELGAERGVLIDRLTTLLDENGILAGLDRLAAGRSPVGDPV
jgi:FMN reductase